MLRQNQSLAAAMILKEIYSSPDLLAFAKPAGLPSAPHSARPTEDSALTRALAQHPELALAKGLQPWEPALLHRLDTGTSGVLLFARTQEAFAQMRAQWKSLTKTYRAWVSPASPQAHALLTALPHAITWPLAHSAKSAKRMLAVTPELPANRIRGRALSALTEIVRVHTHKGELFDLEIRIQTGVMHQIRAHLAASGLPIVGDPIYGTPHAEGMQLHAWRVEISGIPTIEAPLERGIWLNHKSA